MTSFASRRNRSLLDAGQALTALIAPLALVAAAVLALAPSANAASGAPEAAAIHALGGTHPVLSVGPRHAFSMRDKWAREVTRYGDVDADVYSIHHVRELQYRLGWAGTFRGHVNGHFGKVTRAAVKRYQRREGLRVTGVATHVTWAHLIHDTIRGRGAIPHICKTDGWHACYDRWHHQVTLWHNGEMRNSWLVRGGESDTPTRVGNTTVYYRDIDHYSQRYDAPMPYAQFFDGGEALHGSVFMIDPFVDHSHGCVNMYLKDARQLWHLTSKKTLHVSVYGAWS